VNEFEGVCQVSKVKTGDIFCDTYGKCLEELNSIINETIFIQTSFTSDQTTNYQDPLC